MKARVRGLVQRSVGQLPINGGYAEGISSIRLGSNAGSVRGKAEQFVLPGPYGRQICEASDAQAGRQSAFDGRFDETGREEGKRDRHVYFADAAVLSSRNSDFPKMDGKDPTTDMACYAASRRRGRGARGSKSINGMARPFVGRVILRRRAESKTNQWPMPPIAPEMSP
jgi:hypothetical protein